MTCDKCGIELKHDDVFCPDCGSENHATAYDIANIYYELINYIAENRLQA